MVQKNTHVDVIEQLFELDSHLEIIESKYRSPQAAKRIKRFRDYIQRVRKNLLLTYIQNLEIDFELHKVPAQQAEKVLKKANTTIKTLRHPNPETLNIKNSLSEVQQATQMLLSSLPGAPTTPPPEDD